MICSRLCLLYFSVSFPQCGSLLDPKKKNDFVGEVAEEYQELRDDHYDSLKVGTFVHSFEDILLSYSNDVFML